MKILLLEDNPLDSDLVCRKIEKEIPGSKIDSAATLKEAHHFLNSNTDYQAAVLDVNLPDGSGLEFLMDIRSKGLNISVIILTAFGDEEIAISAMKAGADDFVLKGNDYYEKLVQSLLYHRLSAPQKNNAANEIIQVLYAEHHDADLDLTLRHFRKYAPHFKIQAFKTGDELLAHLKETGNNKAYHPILLIDYRLPGLDGLETTKSIRQNLKLDHPIVIITGQGNEEIAIQALRLGVDDYMVKRDNYVLRLPSLLQNVYQRWLLEKQQKALQESEQHYRLLAENADDVIFTLDMDLRYTYISPSIYKLRGFTPDEVVNKHISDMLSPESYKKALEELQQALHPDPALQHLSTGPLSLELEVFNKNKSKIWVEIKASLLIDEHNIPYGVLGVTRDITEKKQAQNDLSESLAEYKMFFDDDLTGDYITSVEGKLLNCNPAYLNILGLKSIEEAHKLDLYSVYPTPKDRDLLLDKLREHKKLVNHEFEMRRTDGKVIYVIANITGVFNEQNELVSLRGYLIDNTARKIATDELHKISQAIKQNPTSILITNLKGEIEYVNPKFCEISGYAQHEVIGKNPRFLKSGGTPHEDYKKLWETLAKGKDWHGEFLNKRKDGTLFWEHAAISVIRNTEGEITHYLAVKEDITEKKRLENIQEILVYISNAVLISDTLESFSKLIYDELTRMIDMRNFYIALYDEQTEMISTPFLVYSQMDDPITDYSAKNTLTGYVIKEKKPMLITQDAFVELLNTAKVQAIGPDSEIWIGVPLFSKQKAIGAIVIQNYKGEKKLGEQDMKLLEYVAPQISLAIERKRAVEDLKVALENAEASDRLKTAFLNNISHEIRTPLNGILGFAPFIIQPDIEQEEKEKFLETLNKSGERLMDTVTDYMDISLLVSGNLKMHPKPVNIHFLMEEIHQKFQSVSESKGLKFDINMPQEILNYKFISDAELIKKIVSHLLSNAFKFTDSGYVSAGYRIMHTEEEAEIEFFVKDSGRGISEKAKTLVFESFRQENEANTRAHEGSGLGLSISKGLVSLLGGSIHLETNENKGTSVFVRFPVAIEASSNISQMNSMEKKTSAANELLIAEDDDMNYLFFETVLRNKFANIYRAENGQDAVDRCKEYPDIAVVLMDIKMPGMDGLEATRQIKSIRPELPIIAVTAFAMHGDENRIREAGCNDYLSKPVDKMKLMKVLGQYVAL
ncbi:MAG: response regulator [Bacteroidales bacterium]|nr:response regulator [Bacteroidales bacterium]